MIVFENKGFQTNSLHPNSDWTGKALYVIDDKSELANKIKKLYPYYDFVLDDKGNLIDVVETEHEPEQNEDLEYTVPIQDDVDTMLIDHEYRLTLLELGVNE